MQYTEKIGFWSVLLLIFLLPIFFLPTGLVPLGIAKVSLITLAAVVSFGSILVNMFRHKSIALPKSYLLWMILILPAVYIFSALFSGTPSLSLFGYALEPGTAASMAAFSALLFVSAIYFRDRLHLIRALSAFFLSLFILAIFVAIKIITGGNSMTFGVFSGSMGNPLGAWTDLGIVFGLFAILSTIALEMLPVAGMVRALLWIAFVLSTALLVVINFSTAWVLVLGSSVVLIVYLMTVERSGNSKGKGSGVLLAGILAALAVLFIWNPSIGAKDLVSRVAEVTNVSNVDVRPSLSATLDVTKKVIKGHPVLGSGPNTFDKDWLLYRTPATNSTQFWNAAFPFGFGFLPTAAAATGLLGSAAWIIFFILLLMLGLKALSRSPENKSDRFMIVSTLLVSLFLWVGAFMYVPSITVLAMTFIFTGLFVAAVQASGVVEEREVLFSRNKITHFTSVLASLLLVVATAAFALGTYKKVAAAIHFERALIYSQTAGKSLDDVESELGKAITTSPSDPYWGAVSQVELTRANNALNDTAGTDSKRQQTFQNSLSASIAALQNAIALNPSYANWIALGNVYESLVPAPLSVQGAYDSALASYKSASALNPESPEIPLLLARLELDNKDVKAAREHIAEALERKQDYADAYFLLSQLEVRENNLNSAIKSAETGAVLSPGNAGVLFELGLLKYANRDYRGAADALKRALAIVPDYANAKYYLGLSLDKLGQKAEALKEFEDLAKTNADNTLVIQILANLRAGRSALTETPAVTGKTAPISGQ
ncbi:tetratricopeptide repeat protein [Candidatus Parcubacteria bacterium]|nr:tetratricopeptide repeat protein [Candidatus Parcubacteria bacterium]